MPGGSNGSSTRANVLQALDRDRVFAEVPCVRSGPVQHRDLAAELQHDQSRRVWSLEADSPHDFLESGFPDRVVYRVQGKSWHTPGTTMIPAVFGYERPRSVADTVSCLAQYGAEARVRAGGHSLLPLLKVRAIAPKLLIDIGGVAELREIAVDESTVTIGALVTQVELTDSDELRRMFPLLVECGLERSDSAALGLI